MTPNACDHQFVLDDELKPKTGECSFARNAVRSGKGPTLEARLDWADLLAPAPAVGGGK